MKKKVLVAVLVIAVLTNVFADEYTIRRKISSNYYGTYIPVIFDTTLKETRSYDKAAMANKEAKVYDILMLNNEKCHSNVAFHDAYTIKSNIVDKWKFSKQKRDYFITDENGNKYIKISSVSSFDDGGYYDVFDTYVLSILFEDARNNKNIKINKGTVTINNHSFTFIADVMFVEKTDAAMWLYGTEEKSVYVLKVEGRSAKIYKTIPVGEEGIYTKTDEVFMEFQLF